MRTDVRTLLALEDGRYFEGESFGATGTRVGEVCFNTGMTGYQEVLTDPSYRGQIVAMTYPLIGNYGINSIDQESSTPHVRGFVIEELTEIPSNWRSEMSLDEYLRRWDIPGAKGIDTRALTRHLRTRGAMKACLTTENVSAEEATRRAIEGAGVVGMDYVREVSTKKIYAWDPDDKLSPPWSVARDNGGDRRALPPTRFRIVAYDYGMKENILRLLRQKGFAVTVVPASTPAEDALPLARIPGHAPAGNRVSPASTFPRSSTLERSLVDRRRASHCSRRQRAKHASSFARSRGIAVFFRGRFSIALRHGRLHNRGVDQARISSRRGTTI